MLLLLGRVREKSMMYAKTKQTNMSRIEEELEKPINWLQKEIDRSSRDEPGKQEMHRELEKKKRELEQIIEHKTKGAILRSKCRWYNEGERNTKYFLNLEKRYYKNGVISQLKVDDDQFVTSDKDILNACESFYKNIYSSSFQRGDSTSCKSSGDTSPSGGVINFPIITHTAAPLLPLSVLLARQKNVGNLSSQH